MLTQRITHDHSARWGIGIGKGEALSLIRQFRIGDFNHLPCQWLAGLERLAFSRAEDLIGSIGSGHHVASDVCRSSKGTERRGYLRPSASDHYERSILAASVFPQDEAAKPAYVEPPLSDVEFSEQQIELVQVGADGEGDNDIPVPER